MSFLLGALGVAIVILLALWVGKKVEEIMENNDDKDIYSKDKKERK